MDISNIQNDRYNFTLTASDAQGQTIRKTIVVETPSQKPYPDRETPHQVPGKIEFEEYDSGGEGLGFFDQSAQNLSLYSYRDSVETVDLGRNGTVISSLEEGEWLEYTVNVEQSGYYKLSVRHHTIITPGVEAFHVILPNKGDTLLKNCQLLYTGRSDYFVDPVGEFFLSQGENVIRFDMLNTGIDLDYFELELTQATNVSAANQNPKGMKVYPNPARETIYIELHDFSEADIQIYN